MTGNITLSCEQVGELAAGYVLDALEPAETEAVRAHLDTCTDRHDEFAELGGVVPYLAETVEPVEPPSRLRSRVVAAVADDIRARAGAAHRERLAPPVPPVGARSPARAADRPVVAARRSPLAWVAAAAAAFIILALAGATVVTQSELEAMREYERGVAAVLDLAARDGSQTAILTSDEAGGAQGIAAIGSDGRLLVALRGLSATSGTQVYEAWAIAGDESPVPLGDFRVDEHGTATFAGTAASLDELTLAITLEPRPGATTPTMPIVAAGKAAPPPG